MKKTFGYNELMACSYNAMIPYLQAGVKVEDTPFYTELSEYEINMYDNVLKELEEKKKKYGFRPILDPMEKDWD